MLPSKICFVDTETTGTSALAGRIIEIGIIRMENGKKVREFKSLINPGRNIDPFITDLTGITNKDLENAPSFYEIKDEIADILNDSVFVAHSVRFDYGFIRNEFKRNGSSFSSKYFCTVKLARLLYPNEKRYNLDSIIEKFGFTCKNRHRAYDDAKVLFDFFKKAKKEIKKDLFEQAVMIAMKRPTTPINIPVEDLENLPENPGVYIFYGENGSILYIGKSINLRDRILSHFSNDHLSLTDMKISREIRSIETIETAGELGALLLESTMIKKHQPIFNRMLRESKKMPILLRKIDENGFNTVEVRELDSIEIKELDKILGVFRTDKQAKDFLYTVAKEYHLCPRLLGLEKGKGLCFYYHLKECLGACGGKELNLKYNLRFEEGFYSKKIRPWNFESPILIREEGEKSEAHVIDKWCYLGSIKNEFDLEEIERIYRFDFDTYKILNRFILDPKNQKKITILKN